MSENIEIWKPVVGYEGLYECSNMGNVKSLHYHQTDKEQILKPRYNKWGYASVVLKGKPKKVHRLVAQAFPEICGEWIEGGEVDHINTDRSDNNATNLRIVKDRKENCNNPLSLKHYSKAHKGRKCKEYTKIKISQAQKGKPRPYQKGELNGNAKAVLQFNKDGYFIKEYPSIADACRELNLRQSGISACCLGLYKKSQGFIWKYKDVL